MNEKDEIRFGFSKDESEQKFDLEDILKEFAPEDEELQEAAAEVQPEETPEEPVEPQTEEVPTEEPETVPEEVTAEEPEVPAEEVTPVAGDTVRLDDVAQALKDAKPQEVHNAAPIEEEEDSAQTEESAKAEPFSEEWEPEYEQPMGDYVPPEPIVFRPKSRLRELKKKLVAGPERRYYELSEIGVGNLQLGMVANLLIVLLTAGSTVFYGLNLIPDNRMKLLIFMQVLMMLLAGLFGSHRLVEGGAPGLHFYTLNMAKPTRALLQRLS